MPGALSAGHSHRPTTKTSHKPFKSRKATKGQIRDAAKGRTQEERGQRKTPHQQVMSKLDRRNQAKQRQLEKAREHQRETSVFSGRDGAPRNVAVIPLCADSDTAAAIQSLNGSVDIEAEVQNGCFRVPVDRFKQKLQYIPLKRDLTACLDAARVADFVVLVLSAEVEVDDLGELILRSVESQGMSTLFTVIQGLNKIEPAKQRLSVVSSLKSYISHFHPEQDKLYSLDNRQECSNLMRSLCSTTPKGIKWRDERSWMLVEEVKFASSKSHLTTLTGVVRGKGLKADRLVQIGDWGTFQIEKITAAPLATRKKKGEDTMNVDEIPEEEMLDAPTEDQDGVDDLAPEETAMDDAEDEDMDAATTATTSKKGVLLDDHHYFSDDDQVQELTMPKKVPKGTSKYQSAWFLDDDDVSDSGSDLDDEMQDVEDGEEAAQPEDGMEGLAGDAMTEAGPSEYPQSVAFVEPDEEEDARALEAYRKYKRTEAEDDLEFPDEIELHPNVLARERLAKYRGLKSLRTSPWLEDEDRAFQPEEWQRLLRIPDYQASRIRAAREALVGGITPGTRVHVHVKGVPPAAQQSYNSSRPVTLFSLLRHEHKRTAVNVLINFSSDHPNSIKAKEELIIQYGPRRLVINPLFSQGGSTPNDVHKYCRYLHPGQSAVATFMGPVTWGSVPALFFKRTAPGTSAEGEEASSLPLTLVATGTTLPPSTSRVIAKRAILTGHPYHIHKKIVTIRYMFFNREDVEWFKALPLWTKRGRSGYIKEALGTHGYFKATFDGRINPQDAIGVSLYKRVWPRNARSLDGLLLDPELVQGPETDAMEADVE
ncbi:ribosome bioproteinsis protein tsr1 [Madurella fahalii]|uniref:Ribosome bioproteinsis protein tsr1 n=1 Tax=Madurella fahalii TaxID=1157608 RepID=A0ABQ0G6F6_9PEZI